MLSASGKKKPITVPMTSCLYRPGSTGRYVAEESASKFLTVVNGGTELFEHLELQPLVSRLFVHCAETIWQKETFGFVT